jgi:hypothetical protein
MSVDMMSVDEMSLDKMTCYLFGKNCISPPENEILLMFLRSML